MKIVDLDLKSEVALPEVNRNRFIMNRNLIYALVADGPLYVLSKHLFLFFSSLILIFKLQYIPLSVITITHIPKTTVIQ